MYMVAIRVCFTYSIEIDLWIKLISILYISKVITSIENR